MDHKRPKVFSTFPPDLLEPTVARTVNQVTYNAFLAIWLSWSLLIRKAEWQTKVAECFLIFVAIASVVGAFTVTSRFF